MDFGIEKRKGNELDFIWGENVYEEGFERFVRVGKGYEEKVIGVCFCGRGKYEIESVG